jgi:putative tricarboxylic transport membrane protein
MIDLFEAFVTLFHWSNILAVIAGVVIGLFLGAIPGIGAAAALAIFLPFTYSLPVESSVLLLISIYAAAEYGGSISAIAISAPGTGGAAATILDGFPLAQKGLPGKALSTSLYASVSGGLVSAIVLTLLAPPLAQLGIKFGPAEMFSLIMCGLAIIASLSSGNMIKGTLSAALGLLIATVGIDPFTGYPRYCFNLPQLQDGIKAIPVMIGLFALAQAFKMLENAEIGRKLISNLEKINFAKKISLREFFGLKKTILRGSVIGTLVGIVPGVGVSVGSFIAYDVERKSSKEYDEFGKGKLEGIAAPESANNAVVGGALVPAIALGIPGSAAIGILLGAFIMNGIVPGPFLLENNKELVYLIFSGYFTCNLVMLVVGLTTISLVVRVLKVSPLIMAPVIIAMTFLGAFVYAFNYTDVIVVFIFGVIGWLFKKIEVPVVPLVIALLLGGLAERNFLSALTISRGDPMIFIYKPISLLLLLLAIASFIFAFKKGGVRRK